MDTNQMSVAEIVDSIYKNGNCDIEDVIERNHGVYLNIDGAHRWIFGDQSVFVVDAQLNSWFINVCVCEPKAEPKQPWYKRFSFNKEKKTIAVAAVAAGVFIAGGAASAVYFSKK